MPGFPQRAGGQAAAQAARVLQRQNCRRAREPVRAFCAQQGIAYRDSGFFASYAQVLRHLHTVGSLRPELEY